EKGLNKWTGWIERYEKRIAFLSREQEAARNEQERLQRLLADRRNESEAAIKAKKEFSQRMSAAQERLQIAEQAVKRLGASVLTMFRNPHALSALFAGEMLALKGSLDRAKLPESSAREFFEELARETVCVCGRELDDAARARIQEWAHHYLGTEDVALL